MEEARSVYLEACLHLYRISSTFQPHGGFEVVWPLLAIKWLNKMPEDDRREKEQELKVTRTIGGRALADSPQT